VTRLALAALFAALCLAPHARAANDPPCDSGDGKGRRHLRIVGLTSDGRLVCFNEERPGRTRELGEITGLTSGDTALVGIDFRVQDGLLWGVGNAGGVYTLDVTTAVATPAGALTVPLEGTSFGVDFNPAADRLRIVSHTGQNLRHNVNAGGVTLEDGDLFYTAGTPATDIAGAAYTNNDLVSSTATTLFDLDATQDQIALQAPPNAGSLGATGKLGVDAEPGAGFDVYSVLDKNGVAVANRGFAVLRSAGAASFYELNLLTGAARLEGSFRDADVIDIAVPLDQ
jgi:hypothetical protein